MDIGFRLGRLPVLPVPMHGKPLMVDMLEGRLFEGLPSRFEGERYHRVSIPEEIGSVHPMTGCLR